MTALGVLQLPLLTAIFDLCDAASLHAEISGEKLRIATGSIGTLS
jgi:hypothetical protein